MGIFELGDYVGMGIGVIIDWVIYYGSFLDDFMVVRKYMNKLKV